MVKTSKLDYRPSKHSSDSKLIISIEDVAGISYGSRCNVDTLHSNSSQPSIAVQGQVQQYRKLKG